jgi:hypothetical protein
MSTDRSLTGLPKDTTDRFPHRRQERNGIDDTPPLFEALAEGLLSASGQTELSF